MKVGYARVSTRNQDESLETQRATLKRAGCERVFTDAISGARADRPGLRDALNFMRPEDSLVVTRLDRLGRTVLDTLKTIDDLAEHGIAVQILDPELDTRTKEGKLMVTIMSGLAQWERELLIARTKEGLAFARAHGRVGGSPPKLNDEQVALICEAADKGQTVASLARAFGVSRPTIYRALERGRNAKEKA